MAPTNQTERLNIAMTWTSLAKDIKHDMKNIIGCRLNYCESLSQIYRAKANLQSYSLNMVQACFQHSKIFVNYTKYYGAMFLLCEDLVFFLTSRQNTLRMYTNMAPKLMKITLKLYQ